MPKSPPPVRETERVFTRLRMLAVPFLLLLGGCASLEDWAARQQFLDHDSRQAILPHLLDSYQQKMTKPALLPTTSPAPADLNRG